MGHNKHSITGTLMLSGEGRVDVKPDIATVLLSVITEEKMADAAVASNARKANDVIERLLRIEIPRDAMTTTGLNLYPVYQSDPQTNAVSLAGYRAQVSILVTAPVQLAGRVFDAGIAAGANESSGISFGLKDEKPFRERARDMAVVAARAEAEAVCRAMDVRLVGPRTIQVSQGGGAVRVYRERMMKADTPVLPGELSITASAQVTFEYQS
jgi:uncharacterized protein